jgi:hypothetical protein
MSPAPSHPLLFPSFPIVPSHRRRRPRPCAYSPWRRLAPRLPIPMTRSDMIRSSGKGVRVIKKGGVHEGWGYRYGSSLRTTVVGASFLLREVAVDLTLLLSPLGGGACVLVRLALLGRDRVRLLARLCSGALGRFIKRRSERTHALRDDARRRTSAGPGRAIVEWTGDE